MGYALTPHDPGNPSKPKARQVRRRPRLYFGFPVAEEQELTSASGSGNGDGKPEQKGIALLIAIMIISIMMLFTGDLILSSRVNVTLATQLKDNLKAEYMVKSGMNMATLLLSSDLVYQLYQAQQDPKATLTSGLGDIWTVMNGLPLGGESEQMTKEFLKSFNLNEVMDSEVLDKLKEFDGVFTINISDESQRININSCFSGKCSQVLLMLESLFSCPAEKQFLEQKKLNGRELAYRIRDYIKKDAKASEESGFADKNEPYQRRTPRQMAKAAPLDSLDELRMVEGWDADMQAVFEPYLTGFPIQHGSTDTSNYQLNINTAQRGLLQCLFPETKGDCAEKVAIALKKRDEEGTNLSQPGENINDTLRNLLCYAGGDNNGNSGEANNRGGWFKQYSMTFRIEVEGTVGGSNKKLTAVVERIVPDAKKNERFAYRILYWKVI